MPKIEGFRPSPRNIEMTGLNRNVSDRLLQGLYLGSSRAREQQIPLKKEEDQITARSRTLKLDLDETDILKSTLEIQDDNPPPKFRFWIFLLQTILSYGLLIGINKLYTLQQLPYFLCAGIFAFFDSLSPFKYEHLLIFMSYPLLIGNSILNCQYLSYPTILICYLSVAVFQKKNKVKNLFPIYMFGLLFVYTFLLLPAIYSLLDTSTKYIYIYIYPIIDLIIEVLLDMALIVVNEPQALYWEMYTVLLGVQYGTAMTMQMSDVQFWYLCVIYTIRLVNTRKQFFVRFIRKGFAKLAFLDIMVNRRCPSYRSGFMFKFTSHSVAIIYIYSFLELNNYPFVGQPYTLSLYTGLWYQPLIIWSVLVFYEMVCLKFDPKRQQKSRILLEFRELTIWNIFKQTIISLVGMWLFYAGFYIPKVVIGIV